ncbi:MAG: phosphonate C-P lyase system protein PhnH [Pseudomonadota bacterium]
MGSGFTDPPIQAAHAFRAAMTAMACPGDIKEVAALRAPAGLSTAAATLLLTLTDGTTPVHLAGSSDRDEIKQWLTFHTGAPLSDASGAAFALGTWDSLLPLDRFQTGTPEYPDRSATLIVEMPELSNSGNRLTGPGIQTETSLSLPDSLAFQRNARLFPLGLDFFFTAGDRLAALPRTTKVDA